MTDQATIDQEMKERLRLQVFTKVLKGFFLSSWETKLRQGKQVSFYLPHSTSGPSDHVKIGGAFFSAAESPIQDAEDILADLMAAARPFCQYGFFELDIQDLEHVKWRVREWHDEDEILAEGGPEPLGQALVGMSSMGHEGEPLGNLLSLVGALEEQLPDWEVTLFRSCCLSLRKEREDRLFYAIDLSLAPGDAVVASTSIRDDDQVFAKGKRVATHREHILPFVLEVAKRIEYLAPPLSKAVATRWGQVPVVIAPPDISPDELLPEMHRLLEI